MSSTMKYSSCQLFFLLNISLVTIGVNIVTSDDPEVEIQNYDYSYGTDVERPVIKCYTCVSHIRDGLHSGTQSCGEPFKEHGIPEVECEGACTKIYHHVGDEEHTLHRTCLPHCKESSDENGFTTCCYSDLCNGATSVGSVMSSLMLSVLAVVVVAHQ